MPDEPRSTTITVPSWAKGFLKYLVGLVPIVFAFWLSVHDLQRDFADEKVKIVTLHERLDKLERANQDRRLAQVEMSTDLKYIRETMERLSTTIERLVTE